MGLAKAPCHVQGLLSMSSIYIYSQRPCGASLHDVLCDCILEMSILLLYDQRLLELLVES